MADGFGEGLEEGSLGIRRLSGGGDDDGGGDVVVVEEAFGKLDEGDEVAHAWTW